MFCPECGKKVEGGALFCPDCGAKVSETQKVGGVAIQTKGEKTMEQKKGFFASLFDFSFTEFITTRIIKVLYGLGILGAVLGAGAVVVLPVIKEYSSLEAGKILVLILLFPLLALLYIIILRVFYEIIIVLFRIAEYTRDIARQGQRKS